MKFSRRNFLKMGGAVSVGSVLAPTFVARTLHATSAAFPGAQAALGTNAITGGSKALVIIQLGGGNDGLNTVIPYAQDNYNIYKAKRSGYSADKDISVPRDQILALSADIGLHPAMTDMKAFYDAGNLAVVQGVGYPNPDYSHFRAMEIWQTAAPEKVGYGVGWIGRYLESLPSANRRLAKAHITNVIATDARRAPLESRKPAYRGDLNFNRRTPQTARKPAFGKAAPQACTNLRDIAGNAVGLTDDLSVALWATKTIVPSIVNFDDFRFYSDSDFDEAEAMARLTAANDLYSTAAAITDAPEAAYIGQSAIDALDISQRLVSAGGDDISKNPHYAAVQTSYLAYQLFHVGEMLKADLDFRIFYLSTGGFDTHDHQKEDQATLLTDLSQSLKAFWDDMADCGLQQHVAVMTFSEFGRRVEQNASGGTDHGSAEPMFILSHSDNLAANHIIGKTPNLATDIYPDDAYDSGNIIPQLDFRSVYASVMKEWIGVTDSARLQEIIQHNPDPAAFGGDQSHYEPANMGISVPIFAS